MTPATHPLRAAVRGALLFTLALGVVGPPAAFAQEREATANVVQSVAGEWRLPDVESAEADIDQAIGRVVSQMNVFTRPFARSRIDENVNPHPTVSVEPDGAEHVKVAFGDRPEVRLPIGGPAVEITGQNGKPVQVRATVTRGQLRIEETTNQGVRTLSLQAQTGDNLVLSARIQADRLPDDIVYRLDYQRSDRPPRVARR